MTREEMAAAAREAVATWPPMSDEQVERIAVLLRDADEAAA